MESALVENGELVVSAKQRQQLCRVQHLCCLRCRMHLKGRFGESTQLLHLALMVETLMTVERQKMGGSAQWGESWWKENRLRDQNAQLKKSQSRQDTPPWP